jgi:3-dehydroquinate synthetase
MESAVIKFGDASTPYYFGYDCFEELSTVIAGVAVNFSDILLVADSAVSTFASRLAHELRRHCRTTEVLVDATEKRKRLSEVERVIGCAVEGGVGRNTVVVALGGGLVANVAGIAAALAFRGVPLIQIPTTPVGAFDAVLSMKQGVNLSAGKNLAGAYIAPLLIAADLSLLQTIPESEMNTGLVEMAKNVLAVRPDLKGQFVSALGRIRAGEPSGYIDMLKFGIEAKSPSLAGDPKEQRDGLVFEYGHTIGHALEFCSSGTISHGEGVAWGMLAAAKISAAEVGLSGDSVATHAEVLDELRLDFTAKPPIPVDDLMQAIMADNKRGYLTPQRSEVSMVLLSELGEPVLTDSHALVNVSRDVVEGALHDLVAARV